MSAAEPASPESAPASESAAAPATRGKFMRRRVDAVRLDADSIRRQSRIVNAALARFGSGARAMAFLNAFHDSLGGRAIDLAVASEIGFADVERTIGETDADAEFAVAAPVDEAAGEAADDGAGDGANSGLAAPALPR